MVERVIIVHSLADARAAMAAAADLGTAVTLASAAGAAGYLGALWFRELVNLATAERPEVEVRSVLDCGDKPGLVLAALRAGLKRVRFTGKRSTAGTLAGIAANHGAELLTGRLRSFDLLDHPEPEAACRHWLARP